MNPFNSNGDFVDLAEGHVLRQAAVRGAGVSVAGQAASAVLQIGSVVVLARLLTPAEFGIVTMVTTFSLMFRSFGLNGFTELIMQREGLTHSLASNFFWIQLGIGTILTLAFAGSAPLLALLYHNSTVAPVAELASLTIWIGCLGWIHMGLLQRAMRFRAAAIINLAALLLYVIVSISLAMVGWHYWALIWGMIAQSAAVTVFSWTACRWVPSWPRRVQGTGSGLKFAMSVYSHFAFSYSTRNTDNLLVGWRYGAGALGFYKKAYDLFVLPETQLLAPISAVAVSTLSRVNQDREQFQRYFLRLISILAVLGMGIGADFALVGKDLIRFLLGPGWEDAGRIFALFGPGIGVMLLYNTHGWVHLSIGRPERWFRWGLMEFACTAGLFLLALRWGPSGMALAWTISYFILMFPGFSYAGKPIGLGIGPILAAIWRFFVASVVAAVVTLWFTRTILRFGPTLGASSALFRTALVSLIFFGLYLGTVIALHGGLNPINETLEVFRDVLPRRESPPTIGAPTSVSPISNPEVEPKSNLPLFSNDPGLHP